MAMRWVLVVLLVLALSLSTVSAAEFEYTIRGGSMDSFDPYYALYSDGKVLVSGIYSKGLKNYIALIEVTPDGKALPGTMLSLSFDDGTGIGVPPLGTNQILLRASNGYYLISEAHSKKTESFDSILILKLDKDLNVRWGEMISAYVNRTYGGTTRLVRTHIYPRDAVLDGKYLYILAKLGKWAVVLKVFADENNKPLYGRVLWTRAVRVTLGLTPIGLLVDRGRIYVVSTNAESAIGGSRIILIEMLTNGTVLNVLSYSHHRSQEGGHLLYASGIAKGAGGLYVIGTYETAVNGTSVKFPAVIKIAQNGSPIWSVVVNEPGLVTNRFAVSGDSLYLGEIGSWVAGAEKLKDSVVVLRLSGNGSVDWAKAYKPSTLRTLKLVRNIWAEGDTVVGTLGLSGSRSVILFTVAEKDPCWRDAKLGTRELRLKFHPVDSKYFEVSTVKFQVLGGVRAENTALELKSSKFCTGQIGTTSTLSTTTSGTTTSTATSKTASSSPSPSSTSTTYPKTSTSSSPARGGICGPGLVMVLVLLPVLRRWHA